VIAVLVVIAGILFAVDHASSGSSASDKCAAAKLDPSYA
jgi:hypothetical protein